MRKRTALTDPTMRSPSTRRRRLRNPPPSPPESLRDWSALPHNDLLALFSRIPHADILRGAGLACASWRRVAVAEPALWRHIDLAADSDNIDGEKNAPAGWRAMARAAVDRSAGRCESFRGRADHDFLVYLAGRSLSLRSLHVTSRFIMFRKEFIEDVIKKLPLLERLVVSRGIFHASAPLMRALLEHCPRMKLLDAGGCHSDEVLGCRLRARCERTIELRKPQIDPDSCLCCILRSQEYVDEHDD